MEAFLMNIMSNTPKFIYKKLPREHSKLHKLSDGNPLFLLHISNEESTFKSVVFKRGLCSVCARALPYLNTYNEQPVVYVCVHFNDQTVPKWIALHHTICAHTKQTTTSNNYLLPYHSYVLCIFEYKIVCNLMVLNETRAHK